MGYDPNEQRMIGGMQMRKEDVKHFEFRTADKKDEKKKKELERQVMSVDPAYQNRMPESRMLMEGETEESEQMKILGVKVRDLNSVLSGKASFDSSSLEEGCKKVGDAYDKVREAAVSCLKDPSSYGENEETKRQLEKLAETCRIEKEIFRDKAEEFSRMLQDANPESSDKNQDITLMDILRFSRSELYETDGIKVSLVSMGPPSLYLLESKDEDGKPVMQFRRGDKVPGKDNQKLIRDFRRRNPDRDFAYLLDALEKDAKEMQPAEFEEFFSLLANERPDEIFNRIKEGKLHISEQCKKVPLQQRDSVEDLLSRFSRVVYRKELAAGDAKIGNGSNLSDRTAAACRLANFLGLQTMICDSKTAVVKGRGKYMRGIVTQQSETEEGEETEELSEKCKKEKKKAAYSKKAVSQLFSLQIFDFLCGQIDRRNGNYHVISTEQGEKVSITGIKAMPDDMCFGKVSYDQIVRGYRGIRPLNQINLRGVPVSLINGVMALDRNVLRIMLLDVLTTKEIDFLVNRLVGLQFALRRIPGLVRGQDGKYAYTGKDQDDAARQAAALREMKKNEEAAKAKPATPSLFHDDFMDYGELEE